MAIDFEAIRIEQASTPAIGMVRLNQQIKLLSQYGENCLGAGVEAFDGVVGTLILNGVKSQFGDHASHLSVGNEGLSEFITKLKSGVKGLKKSTQSGVLPKGDSATLKAAIKEVDGSYAKNGFFGGKLFGGEKQVAVGVIQNYAGKGTPDQILNSIEKIVPQTLEVCKTYLRQTQEFWAKMQPYIKELREVPEGDTAAVTAIMDRLSDDVVGPYEYVLVDSNAPWSSNNSAKPGDKLPALTESQAEKAGGLIREIFETSEKINDVYSELLKVSNNFEVGDEFKWIDRAPKFKGESVLYSCIDWEGLTEPGSTGCSLQLEYLTDVAEYLERWIKSSLK